MTALKTHWQHGKERTHHARRAAAMLCAAAAMELWLAPGAAYAQMDSCFSAAGLAPPTQSEDSDMSIPYFPLHVGDYFVTYTYPYPDPWDYPGDSYYSYGTYASDTIINGKRYIEGFRTNGHDSVWKSYYDNKLKGYTDTEFLYEELSDNPLRDSVTVESLEYFSGSAHVDSLKRISIDTESGVYFNVPVRIKHIKYLYNNPDTTRGGSPTFDRYYTDKFGLVEEIDDSHAPVDPSAWETDLVYCVINGQEYGTKINVNEQNTIIVPSLPSIFCYPNPVHTTAIIEIGDLKANIPVEIVVSNVLGRIVFDQRLLPASNIFLSSFNGAELPQGEYFVSAVQGKRRAIQELFVIK